MKKMESIGNCDRCGQYEVTLFYCVNCEQPSCEYCYSRNIEHLEPQNCYSNISQNKMITEALTEADITKNVLANNLAMLNDSTFSDFKFVFNEEREIKAHKAILAAAT